MCGHGLETGGYRTAVGDSCTACDTGNSRCLLESQRRIGQDERGRDWQSAPVLAGNHSRGARFRWCMGQHSESIAEAEYGLGLNPASLLPSQTAAWLYVHSREDVKAEAQARRTIDAFPDSLHPHFVLGWATWRQGRTAEAVA